MVRTNVFPLFLYVTRVTKHVGVNQPPLTLSLASACRMFLVLLVILVFKSTIGGCARVCG